MIASSPGYTPPRKNVGGGGGGGGGGWWGWTGDKATCGVGGEQRMMQ